MGKFIDLTGQKFGRLEVKEFAGIRKNNYYWTCLCDCGNFTEVASGNFKRDNTKSCGCLHKEVVSEMLITHGHSRRKHMSRTYNIWCGMLQRCNNPNSKRYKDYGGRGITVCHRWLESFENFYADVGDIPDGTTFDRKNNDGNYEPGNWRFATWKEQNNNRRDNYWVEFNGVRKTAAQWAKSLGIKIATLMYRLHSPSWSTERALTEPVRRIQCS